MKKLLGIVVLCLLLVGCATTESIVSSGKIKKNISKSQLQDAFIVSYPGDDPFIPGSGSEYYSDIDTEIIWGENIKKYYVFRYVSEPVSCGILLCKLGNGTLVSWHNTLNEARASLPKKEKIKANDSSSQTSSSQSSTSSSQTSSSQSSTSSSNNSEADRRKALEKRWYDPGYTDASFPQKESFWIFLKSPPPNADNYAELACKIAKSEFNLSGFTITIWDFNKKKYGKARCY
jgi:hypothetical protein